MTIPKIARVGENAESWTPIRTISHREMSRRCSPDRITIGRSPFGQEHRSEGISPLRRSHQGLPKISSFALINLAEDTYEQSNNGYIGPTAPLNPGAEAPPLCKTGIQNQGMRSWGVSASLNTFNALNPLSTLTYARRQVLRGAPPAHTFLQTASLWKPEAQCERLAPPAFRSTYFVIDDR